MAKIDGPVHRIVQEQCAQLLKHPMVVTQTDVNPEVGVALLIERMRTKYPEAHKAVREQALRDWYAEALRYAIRLTREPAVESALSLNESARRAKRANTIESLRLPDGTFVRKAYLSFTPQEGMALAEQYRRSGKADLRRAAQFEADAKQAIQLGLPEDKPYSILVDQGLLDLQADDEADYEEVAG
jgi:hypothetical protein